MQFVILTITAIGIIMLIMAVGIIFKRQPLRGSCGGSSIWDCDGDEITCGACPNRRNRTEAAAARAGESSPRPVA